ncbi:MAG TPA: NlpC/P60 family protein [Candidatus Limnocylindrales bacterium]|nr:NlpC/P60 family protein [Candidatus Limnocylindrales bacterium]
MFEGKQVFKIRTFVSALALAVGLAGVGFQIQSAAAAESEADGVVQFAHRQLNKPYRLGANGLSRYDCSGLVYRTYVENGLATRVGGNRTANGYYKWFKNHGRLTSNPRKGDLVVWGYRGKRVSHIGIFRGYSNGKAMAVSALTSGVAVHKVHGINKPFRAYLRVNIDRW